jgi:hypothetical protein
MASIDYGVLGIDEKYRSTRKVYSERSHALVLFGTTAVPIRKWQPYGSTKKVDLLYTLYLFTPYGVLLVIYFLQLRCNTLYIEQKLAKAEAKHVPSARQPTRRVSPNATDDHHAPPPQGPPIFLVVLSPNFKSILSILSPYSEARCEISDRTHCLAALSTI